MTVYKGIIDPNTEERRVVVLRGEGPPIPFAHPLPLTAGQSGCPNHSPTGHNWGYNGSGPAQLAHDLLHHLFGVPIPPPVYQAFKNDHVTNWDGGWEISASELRDIALAIYAKLARDAPADEASASQESR